MKKRKIFTTILIDLLAIIALVIGIYSLMSKDLNQWQSNIATALVVIAFPTIFYSLFTQFATNKYGKLKDKDDKLWDEMSEPDNKSEEGPEDNASATE